MTKSYRFVEHHTKRYSFTVSESRPFGLIGWPIIRWQTKRMMLWSSIFESSKQSMMEDLSCCSMMVKTSRKHLLLRQIDVECLVSRSRMTNFDKVRRVESRGWVRFGICPTKKEEVCPNSPTAPSNKTSTTISLISRTIMKFPRLFRASPSSKKPLTKWLS